MGNKVNQDFHDLRICRMNPDKSKNPANPDQKQKSHPFLGMASL
jgi:hypothetical protein